MIIYNFSYNIYEIFTYLKEKKMSKKSLYNT